MLLEVPDGRVLHVEISGPDDGVPLIFHHGTPGSAVPLRGALEGAVARGLRFVTFSRPGYGSSTRLAGRRVVDVAPDVRSLLDHLGAQRCVVAGWSGGGPHALATGAVLPDRVAGVLLVASVAPCGSGGMSESAWLAGMGDSNVEEFRAALGGARSLQRFLDVAADEVRGVDVAGLLQTMRSLLPPVDHECATEDLGTDLLAIFREALRTGTHGWLDDDLAFVRPWGFDPSALSQGEVPVFLWQGSEDLMVPSTHGAWLAEHIPGVTAHLERGEGHLSIVVGAMDRMLDELATTL